MNIVAPIGGILIAALSTTSASAQDQDQSNPSGWRNVTISAAGSISPSSATSSVSATTVPQAMERLSNKDMTADISVGTLYGAGKFGTGSTTTIWSSALGARLRLDNLTLSASLPWMQIKSRSTVFTGIDATPVLIAPNTSAGKRTTKGFGDLTLGAAYTIAPAALPVEIELSGRAKINTASKESRLSSGENDYAVGADVSLPMGAFTPFASFTYRFLGDTPIYQLRDGPAASAGASMALGTEAFLLASYHYARAATRQVDDSHELFAGISSRLAGTPMRLTGFTTAGLSNGAASLSGGIAISVGLGAQRGR